MVKKSFLQWMSWTVCFQSNCLFLFFGSDFQLALFLVIICCVLYIYNSLFICRFYLLLQINCLLLEYKFLPFSYTLRYTNMLLKVMNNLSKCNIKFSDQFFSLIAQFCIIFVKFNIQTIDEGHMGLFQQYASIYFYYPLILNLLVQFKFKVTHEKPIMKI